MTSPGDIADERGIERVENSPSLSATAAEHRIRDRSRSAGAASGASMASVKRSKTSMRTTLDANGREYLGYVRESTAKLSRLIDDVTTIMRASNAPLRREAPSISRPSHLPCRRAARAGVRRTRGPDPSIAPGLTVIGDPEWVERALTSLLDNAWKYTSLRAEARVEVGRVVVEGEESFFVHDDGVGFDMAHARQLFGLFASSTRRTRVGNAGASLAIAHRVIESCSRRREALGRSGSGCRRDAFASPFHLRASELMSDSSTTRPILLVEDNAQDEALTLRAFAKNGLLNPIVVALATASRRSTICSRRPPHEQRVLPRSSCCSILKLPRVDGSAGAGGPSGRSHARAFLTRVVILTSSIEDADRLRGYTRGANSRQYASPSTSFPRDRRATARPVLAPAQSTAARDHPREVNRVRELDVRSQGVRRLLRPGADPSVWWEASATTAPTR